MNPPGDDIIELLSGAEHDVLIVAPFIRTEALRRVLDAVPGGRQIRIVTRWRPADILAGASDLDTFELAQERGVELLLRHDLHAKLYAADKTCLVGSANVTATALGWRTLSNLELLTTVDRYSPHIAEFEEQLLAGAIVATLEHRDQLAELVDRLKDQMPLIVAEVADEENTPGLLTPEWIPQSMSPEELYLCYLGEDLEISKTSLTVMTGEISALGLPPGLSNAEFRAWVAAAISQTSVVGHVMTAIDEHGKATEAAVRVVLGEIGVDLAEYPPHHVLRVLERWLSHFLPDRYETAQDTIKLIKAKKV